MGGGGDNSATERQNAIEAQKDAARQQLNYLFGEGGSPTQLDKTPYYYTENVMRDTDYGQTLDQNTLFNQEAYDAANNALQAQDNPNKAAREKIYTDVRGNAFDAGKTSLDESRDTAKRNNSFALFAQGLNGGSEDIDQNALLDRTYNKGILDLGSQADAAESQLRSNDEATRLGLLQSINAGLDQSSAISSAVNSLKNNADSATADANGTSLGDLFATSGALYTKSNKAQGNADALSWLNSNYPNSVATKTSSAAKNGVITSS